MNTDRGAFVALPSDTDRVGIIVGGNGLTRVVLWFDNYFFQDVHFKSLIEAEKPQSKISTLLKRAFDIASAFPNAELLDVIKEALKLSAGNSSENIASDVPDTLCLDCNAKSADCAHGNLRGSQSCIDTRQRFFCKRILKNE
jgi:hypothetical protein